MSIGFANAEKFTLGGAISFNEITNELTAIVSNGAVVTATTVTVVAIDDASIITITGAIAVASGGVAVGASFSTNDIANVVTAAIENATVVATNVSVVADSNQDILAISIGGSFADKFALGGAGSLNETATTVDAHISGGATVGLPAVQIEVRASDDATIIAISGGAAGSTTAAVGAAFSKNLIGDTVTASVDGAGTTVTAPSVEIVADLEAQIIAIAVGGAGAETFALGGSLTLNEITSSITAAVTTGADVTGHDGPGRGVRRLRDPVDRRRRRRGRHRRRRGGRGLQHDRALGQGPHRPRHRLRHRHDRPLGRRGT